MKKNNYTISSGNVFADLELPNAQEMFAKAELVRQINYLIEKKKVNSNKNIIAFCSSCTKKNR